jgi:CheY-like chemotaxis protein
MNTLNARILLAEDVPDNQRLLSHYLRAAGAELVIAPDGLAAVNAAIDSRDQARPFALILMDMQMPALDGLTATVVLRGAGWSGPIVALTANASEQDRARCLEAGCDDYLTKPIDRDALIRACARWLRAGTPQRAGR